MVDISVQFDSSSRKNQWWLEKYGHSVSNQQMLPVWPPQFDEIFEKMIAKYPWEHAKFDNDVFSSFLDWCIKEMYQGTILCISLQARDFSQIFEGCKLCTVKDRNCKLAWNAQLLVCYSAHRTEHLTVHYGWSGNALKTSKIYPILCEHRNLAICFALSGFS